MMLQFDNCLSNVLNIHRAIGVVAVVGSDAEYPALSVWKLHAIEILVLMNHQCINYFYLCVLSQSDSLQKNPVGHFLND